MNYFSSHVHYSKISIKENKSWWRGRLNHEPRGKQVNQKRCSGVEGVTKVLNLAKKSPNNYPLYFPCFSDFISCSIFLTVSIALKTFSVQYPAILYDFAPRLFLSESTQTTLFKIPNHASST